MIVVKQILRFMLLACLFGVSRSAYCEIDTSAYRYLPMNVGNYYVYYHTKTNYPAEYTTVSIPSSVVFNNKVYYQVVGSPLSAYLRYDTSSGNIYQYGIGYPNQECKVDSFWASLNDHVVSCYYINPNVKCFTNGNSITLFGNYTTQEKSYQGYEPHLGHLRKYAKNIGLYWLQQLQYYTEDTWILKGCIINGVVYGDTTITGIYPIFSDQKFTLFPKTTLIRSIR